MSVRLVTIDDVRAAEGLIRDHVSPAPLIRSCALSSASGSRRAGGSGSRTTAGPLRGRSSSWAA